jgi:D-alanyl-D-alanine dipeptidase
MKLMSAKTPGAGYEPGFHAGAPVGRSHITGEPLYAYRGGKFTMDALKRLRRAEKASGQQIRFHDTYRSHAAQAAGHARKPGLVAKPGRSEHERGNAFDLDQSYYSGPNDPKYQSAKRVLEAHGLKQLPKEWWHFSTTGR